MTKITSSTIWLPSMERLHYVIEQRPEYDPRRLVWQFERQLESYFNIGSASLVSSATNGLLAALVAAGVARDDAVLVSPLCPSASILPLLVLGAIPIFC